MSTKTLERSYALPHGYSVTFCCAPGHPFEAKWLPAVPTIRKARQQRKFFDAYRAVRRQFLQEVAATIGGSVLVVDTDEHMTNETILAPTTH